LDKFYNVIPRKELVKNLKIKKLRKDQSLNFSPKGKTGPDIFESLQWTPGLETH